MDDVVSINHQVTKNACATLWSNKRILGARMEDEALLNRGLNPSLMNGDEETLL